MTASSDAVPDGVSSQYLKQLLEQSRPFIPVSTTLPALSFGGETGGICDLALVVALMLTRAGTSPNPTQTLVMALSMLSQLTAFYEEQVAEMEAKGAHREQLHVMRVTIDALRMAQDALEPVTALRIELSAMFRVGELMRTTTFSLLDPDNRDSHVMVSEEILDELQLKRDDVDQFLKILLPGLAS